MFDAFTSFVPGAKVSVYTERQAWLGFDVLNELFAHAQVRGSRMEAHMHLPSGIDDLKEQSGIARTFFKKSG